MRTELDHRPISEPSEGIIMHCVFRNTILYNILNEQRWREGGVDLQFYGEAIKSMRETLFEAQLPNVTGQRINDTDRHLRTATIAAAKKVVAMKAEEADENPLWKDYQTVLFHANCDLGRILKYPGETRNFKVIEAFERGMGNLTADDLRA